VGEQCVWLEGFAKSPPRAHEESRKWLHIRNMAGRCEHRRNASFC
jgi:hypothetical protein